MRFAAECFARLKQRFPSLRYLNFGGGMPVAYRIGFRFDYEGFVERMLATVREVCAGFGVEEPSIVGEFGRYTAADHGLHIFQVIIEKPTSRPGASWYLIDGSLMVALPDTWALGQDFIVLPLNGYERESHSAWLGGLTCDSDDEYTSEVGSGKSVVGSHSGSEGFLTLPRFEQGEPLYIAFFGTGAYQEMLSGVRGAHHCLLPEAEELVIEDGEDGTRRIRSVPDQTSAEVLRVLGYGRHG
jgi:arginine decarboxylase